MKEKNIKNIFSKKKIALLVVLSICFVMCFSTSAYADSDKPCNHSFSGKKFKCSTKQSIGDASSYAVFAKNYTAKVDMEGNIAAKNVTLNGVHFGLSQNVTGNAISYVENFNASSSACEFLKTDKCVSHLIVGNKYNISKSDNDSRWNLSCDKNPIYYAPVSKAPEIVNVKNSSYTIDFEAEFSALASFATSLTKMSNCQAQVSKEGQNGLVTCKDGLNILNLTTAQYEAMANFNIKMSAKSKLVINITDYNGQVLNNNVCINGSRPAYKDLACNLIWNFGTCNKEIKFQETNVGCILAPCGKVDIISSHNGNVIADTVTNSCGEIHKNDFCINLNSGDEEASTEASTEPTANAGDDKKTDTTVQPTDENKEEVTNQPTKEADTKSKDTQKNDKDAKGNTPTTGDSTPLFLIISIAVVSLGVSVFLYIYIKKRKNF